MTPPLPPEAVGPRHRLHGFRVHPAALLLAASAWSPLTSRAESQIIQVSDLNVHYTTDLTVTRNTSTTHTADTSATPHGLELQGATQKTYAKAQADTFAISAATSAIPDSQGDPSYLFAKATAKTVLSFSVAQDASAPLAFELVGNGLAFYSEGLMSLYDLTAAQSMFSYAWACCTFQGNVPWGLITVNRAFISEQPTFLAGHDYVLTLTATTYANNDAQGVSIGLSGLNLVSSVPEPEARSMILVGLGLVAWLSKRRPALTEA